MGESERGDLAALPQADSSQPDALSRARLALVTRDEMGLPGHGFNHSARLHHSPYSESLELHSPYAETKTAKHRRTLDYHQGDERKLLHKGISQAAIDAAKADIKKTARDADTALPELLDRNRTLILGKYDYTTPPLSDAYKPMMPGLVEHGMTDLAIEADYQAQPYLDELMRTGVVTPELKENLAKYSVNDDDTSVYLAARAAALAAGKTVKLVAIDNHDDVGLKRPEDFDRIYPERNRYMNERISQILKNPDAKVVFYVGANHGRDMGQHISVEELMRREGQKVASISPSIFSLNVLQGLSYPNGHPLLVRTRGNTALEKLPFDFDSDDKLGFYDYSLVTAERTHR